MEGDCVKKVIFVMLILWFFLPISANAMFPEEEVIALCNEIRREHGLPLLSVNWEAARAARHKTEDMKAKGYFGHNSPVYGSIFDMLKNFHISYEYAGENIAMGLATPQDVVDAWMASPGHRKNILDEKFITAGVGYTKDGNVHYWVLILIG